MTYPKVYLYRRIVQAKLYIDNNFDSPLDIGIIAGEASFSRFHFIRLFRKIYGKSPYQYLIQVRIEKAKHLLKSGIPVADVCTAIGFESITSFSGLFRRMVGISPAAYQLQQRVLKERMGNEPLQFIPGCFAGKNA